MVYRYIVKSRPARRMCDMTQSYRYIQCIRYIQFIWYIDIQQGANRHVECVTWLSHMCDMTQPYGSLIYVQPIAFRVSFLQFQNWNRGCSSPSPLCHVPLKRDQFAWDVDLYRKRALYHSKRDLRNIKKDQLAWDVGECDRMTLQMQEAVSLLPQRPFDLYRKRSLYQSKRDLRNIKRDPLEWDGRIRSNDTPNAIGCICGHMGPYVLCVWHAWVICVMWLSHTGTSTESDAENGGMWLHME